MTLDSTSHKCFEYPTKTNFIGINYYYLKSDGNQSNLKLEFIDTQSEKYSTTSKKGLF